MWLLVKFRPLLPNITFKMLSFNHHISVPQTKGRSDHHFVLGVSEAEAKVRTILCRGARYPTVVPPPYVSLLDFRVGLQLLVVCVGLQLYSLQFMLHKLNMYNLVLTFEAK